jgi:hypothetical protein
MSKTFDLSTLNLSAGTHEITVKARASGYADSPASNSVSYVVAGEETYTVSGTWLFNNVIDADGYADYTVRFTFDNSWCTEMSIERGLYYKLENGMYIAVYPYKSGEGYTGWSDEDYRTITFDGTQTVSKEFYEWLVANAERKDTIPVAGGTWRFNDVLNTSYISGIDVIPLKFYSWDGIDQVFAGEKEYSRIEHDTGQFSWDDTIVADTSSDKWKNDLYKTISIAENQTLTQEHYNWLVANATYVPNN